MQRRKFIHACIFSGSVFLMPYCAQSSSLKKAYQGLLNYLTPDGFLTHVSQINRGGEELQIGGYRVISQFGMGLLGPTQSSAGGE